jgi:hypothetical protein
MNRGELCDCFLFYPLAWCQRLTIPSLDADAEKTELAPASPHQLETGPAEDVRTEPDVSQEQTANENGGQTTFSYDRLVSKSTDPVSGIDHKRREVCDSHCFLEKSSLSLLLPHFVV